MMINYDTVIDLSRELRPGMPVWPGDPPAELETIASIDREGYLLRRLACGEHTGTHIGTAAHFHADGTTADALEPAMLIRPAIMIDVAARVRENADYHLDVAAVEHWEREHGRIPPGAVVLLGTGWGERWDDPDAYLGRRHTARAGSPMHTPGYGLDAARFLACERNVVGLGIDTHGIDPGSDTAFSVNAYWLQGYRFHLENLTGLLLLPPSGITLFIGALKIAGSSGAPARVLAVC